jgi:FHS family L-fucose permease-like MFS transporter
LIALFGVIAGVNIEEFAQKENSLDSRRILYVYCWRSVLIGSRIILFSKNYLTEKAILLLNPQVKLMKTLIAINKGTKTHKDGTTFLSR